MLNSKSGFLFILWLSFSPSYAQELVVELTNPNISPPYTIDEFGILRVNGKPQLLDSDSANSVEAYTFSSTRGETQALFNMCPGLVTAFYNLRFHADFDFEFPPEGQAAFFKVLDDALAKRKQLADEYVLNAGDVSGRIASNHKFLERCYLQEQKADAELANVFLEIVPPTGLARYFVELGPQYEFSLLSSRLFHECITENDTEFASRLKEAQKCCTLSLDALYKQKAGEWKLHGRLSCPKIYENLTVDQFLKLRSLQGRVRSEEDIHSYLSRRKKGDASMFVKAIQRLSANEEKK